MRITATLLTFGEDSVPDVFGDVLTFAPGSLYMQADRLPLMVNHDHSGPVIGYAERADVRQDGDRLVATFTLLDTPAALQAAAELQAGVRMDVSVGVASETVTTELRDDVEPHPTWGAAMRGTVKLADLFETSTCLRGRMPSAQVDSIESADTPTNEGTDG